MQGQNYSFSAVPLYAVFQSKEAQKYYFTNVNTNNFPLPRRTKNSSPISPRDSIDSLSISIKKFHTKKNGKHWVSGNQLCIWCCYDSFGAMNTAGGLITEHKHSRWLIHCICNIASPAWKEISSKDRSFWIKHLYQRCRIEC